MTLCPEFHFGAVFTGKKVFNDDVGSQINIYSLWKCWQLLKATVFPLGELSMKNASARNRLETHYKYQTAALQNWCWTRRYSAHVQHYLRWFKHSEALKECSLIAWLHVFVHSHWVLSGERLQHNGCVVALLLMPPECPQWQQRFKERTQRTRWSKERFICEFCCCVECQRHVMTEIWC